MKLTDQDTGQVIAEPEFYQHAEGMAGAWTFGAADNSMLVRSASLALDYLKDNHATAQGGRDADHTVELLSLNEFTPLTR